LPCFKLLHVHLVMKHMPRLRNRSQIVLQQVVSPPLHPTALVFSLNIAGVNDIQFHIHISHAINQAFVCPRERKDLCVREFAA